MKNTRLVPFLALLLSLTMCSGCPNVAGTTQVDLSSVRLPPGFRIAVYASNLPGARSLALGPRGTLFVGTRDLGGGRVYAVVDSDGDQRADRTYTVATGLDSPNGVALREGALYVAEISRILRYDDIESRLDAPPAPARSSPPAPRHGPVPAPPAASGWQPRPWTPHRPAGRSARRTRRPTRG